MGFQRSRRGSTLPSATPVVVNIETEHFPLTITLTSADAGRKVELSADDGIKYWTPTYDAVATQATQIVVTVNSPCTNMRLTGAAGGTDTWKLRS